MKPEELKGIRDQQPLAPLRLVLQGGRQFEIRRRDHLFITQDTLSIGVLTDPATGLPQETVHVSPDEVVRVQRLEPANTSPPINAPVTAMKAEDIQRLRTRQPFIPFRLFLADGRTFDVLRRDLILVTQDTLSVGTEVHPTSGLPEKTSWISPSSVVRVEDLLPAAA